MASSGCECRDSQSSLLGEVQSSPCKVTHASVIGMHLEISVTLTGMHLDISVAFVGMNREISVALIGMHLDFSVALIGMHLENCLALHPMELCIPPHKTRPNLTLR